MKYRPLLLLLAALILPASTTLHARPASWHWWISKADGSLICLQTPPGDGWKYGGGPFRDARCTIPDRRR